MHMHHELATLPSGTGDTDTSTIDRLSLTMQSIVGSLEEKECEVPLPPRRMMFTFFFQFFASLHNTSWFSACLPLSTRSLKKLFQNHPKNVKNLYCSS